MDGENNGKPCEQMDDLVGEPTVFGNTHIYTGPPCNTTRFPFCYHGTITICAAPGTAKIAKASAKASP